MAERRERKVIVRALFDGEEGKRVFSFVPPADWSDAAVGYAAERFRETIAGTYSGMNYGGLHVGPWTINVSKTKACEVTVSWPEQGGQDE